MKDTGADNCPCTRNCPRHGNCAACVANHRFTTMADVTGLACGDQIPRPKTDSTMPDATFLGWFCRGKPYDFNSTVGFDTTLTAGWAPKSIDYQLPAGTTVIGETAFEGTPLKSVEIPASCQWVYPNAFKDCAALKQVLVRSADTKFTPTAFDGCNDVYIFALEGSQASNLCTQDNGFIFVKTFR